MASCPFFVLTLKVKPSTLGLSVTFIRLSADKFKSRLGSVCMVEIRVWRTVSATETTEKGEFCG